jgi:hypothetical protein
MPSVDPYATWACPCRDGWTCEERTNVCVRDSDLTHAGAVRDAGAATSDQPGDDANGPVETQDGGQGGGTRPEEDAGSPPEKDAGSPPEKDAGSPPEKDAGQDPDPPSEDSGIDNCPGDPTRTTSDDRDGDGVLDCNDPCPDDGADTTGVDGDSDGIRDCHDGCPADPYKLQAGLCGCGFRDVDLDGDGTIDCTSCRPLREVCDGKDNDCDGIIDNVDDNGDGMHECQRVLVLGENAGYSRWQSSNLLAWIGQNAPSMVEHGNQAITAALLAQTDVIIAQHLSRSYTTEEAVLIRDWVAGGGGMFAMNGYSTFTQADISTNALFAKTGLRVVRPETPSELTVNAHPLTKGIVALKFEGGREVGDDGGSAGVVNRVFLRNETQALGIAQERGGGRLVLFGDDWISFFETNEPEGDKRQFWRNLMNWLGHSTGPWR